jgi:UrcA family protein
MSGQRNSSTHPGKEKTMSANLTRAFIAAAFCAAAATSPQGASAAEAITVASVHGSEPVRLEYRFNPADLKTEQGAQRVYLNLLRKAQRACADERGLMTDLHRIDRRCAAELVNNAVLQIGSAALAQLRGNEHMPKGI